MLSNPGLAVKLLFCSLHLHITCTYRTNIHGGWSVGVCVGHCNVDGWSAGACIGHYNIHDGWSAGACVGHHSANACLTSREGVRCAWANDKICMTPDTAQQRLDSKNIETVESPRCAKRGKLNMLVRFYTDASISVLAICFPPNLHLASSEH